MDRTLVTTVAQGANPTVQSLRGELALAENQLKRLLMDARKEHPMARELRQKIDMLKNRLQLEEEDLTSAQSSNNPADSVKR
jgi:uncharacterized protein involved in exopolysaccharide biosynthesis